MDTRRIRCEKHSHSLQSRRRCRRTWSFAAATCGARRAVARWTWRWWLDGGMMASPLLHAPTSPAPTATPSSPPGSSHPLHCASPRRLSWFTPPAWLPATIPYNVVLLSFSSSPAPCPASMSGMGTSRPLFLSFCTHSGRVRKRSCLLLLFALSCLCCGERGEWT